jgi:hypothetical protein
MPGTTYSRLWEYKTFSIYVARNKLVRIKEKGEQYLVELMKYKNSSQMP